MIVCDNCHQLDAKTLRINATFKDVPFLTGANKDGNLVIEGDICRACLEKAIAILHPFREAVTP